MSKKRIPYWMRYRIACPQCGQELNEGNGRLVEQRQHNTLAIHEKIVIIKCPRCGYVPGEEDEITETYRKDADLTNEEL